MIVDELVAILGYDLKGEGDLKRFNKSLNNASKGISAMGVAAGSFVGTLAADAFSRLAGAISSVPGDIIGTTALFESFQATLETVEGSADKARQSLDWISKFGKTTPYEVAEVTEAFVRLRAYGIDPLDGTLKAAGDAGSAMGVGLMSGVEAIADAVTGENERLKAFGITTSVAGDKITYSWQENGELMSKTLKKNGVEIKKFLVDNFGRRFNDAMDRQSKTFDGMTSNLSDSWTDFQRRVGEAGFFDAVKGRLSGLLDQIAELDKDGTLDGWAKNISTGLETGLRVGVIILKRLGRHLSAITDYVSAHPETFEKLAYGLAAVAAVKFPKAAAILVFEDILTWLEGGDSVIGKFAESLEKLSGIDAETIGTILAVLAGGGAGLAAIVGPVNLLSKALGLLSGSLTTLGGASAAGGVASLGSLGKLAGRGGLFAAATYFGQEAITKGLDAFDGAAGIDTSNRLPEDHFSTSATIGRLWNDLTGGDEPDGQQAASQKPVARADFAAPLNNPLAQFANAQDHLSKMGAGAPASVENTLNDNSDKSVTVNVGGVVVNSREQVSGAVGVAVGSAVGKSAARAAKLPPARYSTAEAF